MVRNDVRFLKNYPPIFDDVTIPFFPSTYDRSDEKVSVVNQTEDGHDDVEVVRREKTTLSLTYNVNSWWAAKFQGFHKQASISVQLYDLESEQYETKTMRMEDYTESLIRHSETTAESMGLYTISFTLQEF